MEDFLFDISLIRFCENGIILVRILDEERWRSIMFFKKKKGKIQVLEYDKEKEIPVLRCSICTGEQVAGFKDIHTGKIRDLMLIKSEQDLENFKMMYGVDELKKVY